MKKENKKIKFGLPGGTLKEPVGKLFKAAGYQLKVDDRLSIVYIDDPQIECFFARAREIVPLINKGILDGGVVSRVSITETKAKVREVYDLGTLDPIWEETKLVLAVPEKSQIKSMKDLKEKKIITRLPEITKNFLEENKISAIVEFSDASNEPKVPGFADAVVEFTNTGATLKAFDLKILSVLMKDSIVIVANPESLKDKWKREKIENLGLLLKGARVGLGMVGLMFHASNDMMKGVLKLLPALKKPTVTRLRGQNWFDVFTVADKKEIREIIPKLKKIGCTDIVEIPLNKVII